MDKLTYAYYYTQVESVLDENEIATETAVMAIVENAYRDGRMLGFSEGYNEGSESWY